MIKGDTLFRQLFGVSRLAFDQYRFFLDSATPFIPIGSENVYSEIEHRTDNLGIEPFYLHEEGEYPDEYYNELAKDVVDIITSMILNTNTTYDQVKIYVRNEGAFRQIRFLFHTKNGWVDDSNVISFHKNHSLLIDAHVKIRCTTAKALRNNGCDVFDEQSYDYSKHPTTGVFTDDMTFHSEYLRWKQLVMKTGSDCSQCRAAR